MELAQRLSLVPPMDVYEGYLKAFEVDVHTYVVCIEEEPIDHKMEPLQRLVRTHPTSWRKGQ